MQAGSGKQAVKATASLWVACRGGPISFSSVLPVGAEILEDSWQRCRMEVEDPKVHQGLAGLEIRITLHAAGYDGVVGLPMWSEVVSRIISAACLVRKEPCPAGHNKES